MDYKKANEAVEKFRASAVKRVLRDNDIELPDEVVRLESSRQLTIDAAVIACKAVYERSTLMRMKGALKRIGRRFGLVW